MRLSVLEPHAAIRQIAGIILILFVALQVSAAQQRRTTSNADDLQTLLEKLKADKRMVVASNMNLTEADKKTFWPMYDAYQKELQPINERLVKAILAYARAYNDKSLTDEQAKKLTDEAIAIEAEEIKLRSAYAGKFAAALPAKTAARYMQIESKIRAALRYDMASAIPLVP